MSFVAATSVDGWNRGALAGRRARFTERLRGKDITVEGVLAWYSSGSLYSIPSDGGGNWVIACFPPGRRNRRRIDRLLVAST